MLNAYQVESHKLPQIKIALEQVFDLLNAQKESDAKQIKRYLTEVQKEINMLEKRYVFVELEPFLYNKYSAELKKEEKEIIKKLEELSQPLSNHEKLVEKGLKLTLNLSQSWSKGNGQQRRRLQALVFPE